MKRLFICITYATVMMLNCYAASSSMIAEPSRVLLRNSLFEAALGGCEAKVKMLLRHVHPDECSGPVLGGVLARFIECSKTPKRSITPIFEMLLHAGADVNARNLTGGTVLHVLAASNLPNRIVFPCIYAVIARGIDTTFTERMYEIQKTALQRAYYFKRLAVQYRHQVLIHRYGLRIAFMLSCNTDGDVTKTVADYYSCSRKRIVDAHATIISWHKNDPAKFEQISNYLQES